MLEPLSLRQFENARRTESLLLAWFDDISFPYHADLMQRLVIHLQSRVKVALIDADHELSAYGVYGAPELILFRNGQSVAQLPGLATLTEVLYWISPHIAQTMSEVRRFYAPNPRPPRRITMNRVSGHRGGMRPAQYASEPLHRPTSFAHPHDSVQEAQLAAKLEATDQRQLIAALHMLAISCNNHVQASWWEKISAGKELYQP